LAARRDSVELILARALGAEWLDRYLAEWRDIALEIDGEDLIAAGVPEGPAVGRGLQAALRRKLDGEVAGREQELAAALEAAGSDDGVA
jgi:tRNA nucleotidyltransferase (CCA-adding enzyme)